MSSHGTPMPGLTIDSLHALQSPSATPGVAPMETTAASPCSQNTLTSTPWLLVLGAALQPLLSRYDAEVVDVQDATGMVVTRRLVLKTIQPQRGTRSAGQPPKG